jgi:hypothetical protein
MAKATLPGLPFTSHILRANFAKTSKTASHSIFGVREQRDRKRMRVPEKNEGFTEGG